MDREGTRSGLRRFLPLWPFGVLLAEVLAFYHAVVFSGEFVFPWDFRYYHFPIYSFAARSFAEGRFPLWDPYTYCGIPFFAGIQNQVFYPPTLVTILFSNATGGAHLLYWMELQLVAHVLFGGIFTYCLLRELGTSRAAALLGGTVFELGPFFAAQTEHLHAVDGAAWIPLALWSVVRLSKGPSRGWTVVLGASVGMAILAGFLSSAAAAAMCTAVLAAALWLRKLARRRMLVNLAGAAGIALGLSAIVWLPGLQLSRMSVSMFRADFRGSGWGVPLAALVSLVRPDYYHLSDLAQYHMPADVTLMYLYFGLVPLGLAVVCVWWRRSVYAVPFAALTIFFFLFMMGDNLPVTRWVVARVLDVAHDAMYAEFLSVGFAIGVAVLAGLGADHFRARPLVMAALCLVTFADLYHAGSGRPMNAASVEKEPGITEASFHGNAELLARLRARMNRSVPADRLDTIEASEEWVLTAPLLRIATAGGADPLAMDRYMQVRRMFTGGERWGRYYQVRDIGSPILDLLDVGWLLTQREIPAEEMRAARLIAAGDLPGHLLYRNSTVLPRFFLVGHVIAAGGMEEAVEAMRSAEFDPRTEAVVEDAAGLPAFDAGAAVGPVKVIRYSPNEVEVEIDIAAPAYLVSSEAYYPGWEASIDGREARILRTNVAFRGLAVPAGRHRVTFRFTPSILLVSGGVSGATLLVMVALLFSRRRRVL